MVRLGDGVVQVHRRTLNRGDKSACVDSTLVPERDAPSIDLNQTLRCVPYPCTNSSGFSAAVAQMLGSLSGSSGAGSGVLSVEDEAAKASIIVRLASVDHAPATVCCLVAPAPFVGLRQLRDLASTRLDDADEILLQCRQALRTKQLAELAVDAMRRVDRGL